MHKLTSKDIKRESGDGDLNVSVSFASGTSVTVPVAAPYIKDSVSSEWNIFRVSLYFFLFIFLCSLFSPHIFFTSFFFCLFS